MLKMFPEGVKLEQLVLLAETSDESAPSSRMAVGRIGAVLGSVRRTIVVRWYSSVLIGMSGS